MSKSQPPKDYAVVKPSAKLSNVQERSIDKPSARIERPPQKK